MTEAKRKPARKPKVEDETERDPRALQITEIPGKTRAETLSDVAMKPHARHALNSSALAGATFAGEPVDVTYATGMVEAICGEVRGGNLDRLTDMLAAQAVSLDAVCSEFTRRAINNLGQYPATADRYLSLALKAQGRCQATVEGLAKIKRGGRQTVKVVHVYPGGQAVVADTVNNGRMGVTDGAGIKHGEQLHGQGAGEPAERAALPRPHPIGDALPMSVLEGPEALPATWWPVDGGAEREP